MGAYFVPSPRDTSMLTPFRRILRKTLKRPCPKSSYPEPRKTYLSPIWIEFRDMISTLFMNSPMSFRSIQPTTAEENIPTVNLRVSAMEQNDRLTSFNHSIGWDNGVRISEQAKQSPHEYEASYLNADNAANAAQGIVLSFLLSDG